MINAWAGPAGLDLLGQRIAAECQAEYDDPADRRFHAQPNACYECVAHPQPVPLPGGVFQNGTLFSAVHRDLEKRGLRVLSHSRVPSNDGGISLGQALVAAARQLEPSAGHGESTMS